MIDVKSYVDARKKELKEIVHEYNDSHKRKMMLVIVQIGDNPASNTYIKGKIKDGNELGVDVILKKYKAISEKKLLYIIKKLNKDKKVNGIIVQLPLPKSISEDKVKLAIAPLKDVDGFNPASTCVPCTPLGILNFLEFNKFSFQGKNAVVIGRSNIVGKPMFDELLKRNCSVSILHSKTPEAELKKYVKMADLIVCATGHIGTLKESMSLKDTCVVIDVGINRDENNKLCGDCERFLKVYYQSPVPGGVGLLTRLALYENLIKLVTIK